MARIARGGKTAFFLLVEFGERTKELVFPLGSVNRDVVALLEDADFVDKIGPLIKEIEELGIDRIDSGANFTEGHGTGSGAAGGSLVGVESG